MLQEFPEATILRPSDIVGEEAKFYNVYLQKGIKVSFFGLNNVYILKTAHVVISYTTNSEDLDGSKCCRGRYEY